MTQEIKQVLRFEVKNEAKLITKLNKLFVGTDEPITEEKAIKINKFAWMDPANVLMVIAKTEQSKRVMSRFVSEFDLEQLEKNYYSMEQLSYTGKDKLEAGSKYSMAYLTKIIDILDVLEESILLKVQNDYPLYVESTHFDFILAPRVYND